MYAEALRYRTSEMSKWSSCQQDYDTPDRVDRRTMTDEQRQRIGSSLIANVRFVV